MAREVEERDRTGDGRGDERRAQSREISGIWEGEEVVGDDGESGKKRCDSDKQRRTPGWEDERTGVAR